MKKKAQLQGQTTIAPAEPQAPPAPKQRKRRRRRRSADQLATRAIREIKQKERRFLREVSQILTATIGFPVRVSRVKSTGEAPPTPDMRRAARLTRRQAHQQIMDAFAPLAGKLNDKLPI